MNLFELSSAAHVIDTTDPLTAEEVALVPIVISPAEAAEDVIDTIYTLQEPINENINDLQTSYVKNKWLFNKVPLTEYDSLWNFGFPTDTNSIVTLDSLYLNK